MSARNRDANGELNDYGCLIVGEQQIYKAIQAAGSADLKIIIAHHPLEWLAEFDRNIIRERIERGTDFFLHGHDHTAGIRRVRGADGDCVVIPAGAAYDRRKPSDPRYVSTYNLVRVDLVSRSAAVFLRRWSDKRGHWLSDTDTAEGGIYRFTLSMPAALKGVPPHTEKPSISPNTNAGLALTNYRNLTLTNCDIVDLANLPEQDRHIVHRQLELRQLYAPLRLQMEIPGKEDIGKDPSAFAEQRRAAYIARRMQAAPSVKRVTLGERLSVARRIIVLGDPGSGKTTLTRWIATAYLLRLKSTAEWKTIPDVESLPELDLLPILVRCRDLDDRCINGNFRDLIETTLGKTELSSAERNFLVKHLVELAVNGKILFVLDGLDEIAVARNRARFCEKIDAIARSYPLLWIVATSRIVGYREMGRRLGSGFEHLTLVELAPADKDDFIRRWCKLIELPERQSEVARELISDIHSTDRIEHLTGNPMLLTTMALVKRKVGKLPQRRAELYEEAVQVLLNWRSEVDQPIDQREALPQLEYLAFTMCDKGVQALREDEVLYCISQMRSEFPNIHAARNRTPEEFLSLLEARTGIIMAAGHTQHLGSSLPVYEFRHLTFQEYLAARALVNGRLPNRQPNASLATAIAPLAGRTSIGDEDGPEYGEVTVVESWREALRLCISICRDDDVDNVMEAIVQPLATEPTTTGRARAILAAQCLVDEPNISELAGTKILDKFISHMQGEDHYAGPHNALGNTAIELKKSRWGRTLIDKLQISFMDIQNHKRFGSGSILSYILSTKYDVKFEDLIRLNNDAIAAILSQNKNNSVKSILTMIGYSFRRIFRPSKKLAHLLFQCLENGEPTGSVAAWLFARLSLPWRQTWRPDTAQLAIIRSALENPMTNVTTVEWLAGLLRPEHAPWAVAALAKWSSNPDAHLREEIVSALGEIGSPAAFKLIVSKLDDSASSVRSRALHAMSDFDLNGVEVFSRVEALISDPDPEVRAAAVEVRAATKDSAALTVLRTCLDDTDVDVRCTAVWSISQFSDNADFEKIKTLATSEPEPRVRNAAIIALGYYNPEAVFPLLVGIYKETSISNRYSPLLALAKLSNERAISFLLDLLANEDEPVDVRQMAVRVLEDVEDSRVVVALISALKSSVQEIKFASTEILGRRKSEVGLKELRDNLYDAGGNFSDDVFGAIMRYETSERAILFSRDFDGFSPFLEPNKEISEDRVREAEFLFGDSLGNVRQHYKYFVEQFQLRAQIR